MYIVVHRPRTTPPLLLIIHVLALCYTLVDPSLFRSTPIWTMGTVAAVISIIVILNMPIRSPKLPTHEISSTNAVPSHEVRSPEDNLTGWQWISVTWMGPMIKVGKKRQMQFEDVWSLGYEFQHTRLHEHFRLLKGSVLKRLMVANGVDLIITSLLGIVEMVANLADPILLQQLLQAMSNPESPQHAAIVYAVLSLMARLIAAQTAVFGIWYSRRAYERSRGQMITMLYEKTLGRKIILEADTVDENGKTQQSASTGKVLNIMRGDAYEVAQRFWEWPSLISKPLGLILAIVLVWKLIGWPCLLGIAVVIVAQLLNLLVSRILIAYERKRRAATDDKLKVITQFVEAIRHLRYNSWEGKWLEGILAARQKELGLRIRAGLLNNLIGFINNIASGLFPVLAFLAYTKIAGEPLRVDIAFPALQLFSMLESSLRDLPSLVTTMINAWVAVGRIEAFMKEPELPQANDDSEDLVTISGTIELEDACFAWPGRSEAVLYDTTLSIVPGLTVVYGKVGSGKTAFLQALLGENDLLSGKYTPPRATIAYCAQTPWLQNMSIRENILFGAPMDMDRYKQVLSACALINDLAGFSNGDLSFIGENGIGLSGGQKARVALARAVYSRAPYLFLDDPISALDQQTAEHIMKFCISSSLCAGRTVLLVTHRLDLVETVAESAIEISEGRALLRDISEVHDSLRHSENGNVMSKQTQGTQAAVEDVVGAEETDEQSADAVKDRFIEEEKRAHGAVKFQVYWQYIRAGRLRWWGVLSVAIIIFRLFDVGRTWFLKAWGESYDRVSSQSLSDPFKDLPTPDKTLTPWLVGFTIFAIGQAVMHAVSQVLVLMITYFAGKRMFHDVMLRVSNAAFRFYDVTPIGRLMNRMTGDVSIIDGDLGRQLQTIVWWAVVWLSSIIVIMSATPMFLVISLFITAAFVAVFSQFLPTSQNLRRLEMVSLSPLMANFGTLIEGLVTVRAFRAQRRFQAGVIRVVDTFQKMDHFYWSLQTWLMVRFDTLSSASILAVTLLAIWTNVSPGLTAFVLTSAHKFVAATHFLCRQYGQLELDFTSVERVVELTHIDQEPAGTQQVPAAWPTSGEILFDHVNIRYAEDLDLILKDINLTIPGGSNVALIGRTGSGKSSLALALLATVRPSSGTTYIDNLDITSIQPSELRKRITFLAQEPTLFVGTMRQNLDPVDEFSDSECSGVLERLGGRYNWVLSTQVEAGGKNLSQGQRQLVQLARAILRRSPLVILDEATASIDLGTSMEVQDILRQEMVRSTVITIAHRVEAVSNADWVVELAKGEVVYAGPVAGRPVA